MKNPDSSSAGQKDEAPSLRPNERSHPCQRPRRERAKARRKSAPPTSRQPRATDTAVVVPAPYAGAEFPPTSDCKSIRNPRIVKNAAPIVRARCHSMLLVNCEPRTVNRQIGRFCPLLAPPSSLFTVYSSRPSRCRISQAWRDIGESIERSLSAPSPGNWSFVQTSLPKLPRTWFGPCSS